MTWPTLFRVVSFPRRARRTSSSVPQKPVTMGERQHRRTAMGIDVSPVHGHHCICDRCLMQAKTRG
jgi:hypothetical protein